MELNKIQKIGIIIGILLFLSLILLVFLEFITIIKATIYFISYIFLILIISTIQYILKKQTRIDINNTNDLGLTLNECIEYTINHFRLRKYHPRNLRIAVGNATILRDEKAFAGAFEDIDTKERIYVAFNTCDPEHTLNEIRHKGFYKPNYEEEKNILQELLNQKKANPTKMITIKKEIYNQFGQIVGHETTTQPIMPEIKKEDKEAM